MDEKNQKTEGSRPACDCSDDPTAQSINCLPAACKKKYEALVLTCIDPRMQKPVYDYLNDKKKRNLAGNYSQVTIAGAAIGVVAPKFRAWRQTFWDNLSISIALHRIPKVIVINHRRCGAATAAYGSFHYGSKDEKRLHRVVLENFRRELAKHHPLLEVEILLMNLKGRVEDLS